MFTARSILSLAATSTATQCSAALPTIATTNTPTKNSDRPIVLGGLGDRAHQDLGHQAHEHARRSPSRISDLRTVQPLPWPSSSPSYGLKTLRWVFSEKIRPAA